MREKRDEILILRITKTEKNRIYEKMYGMGIRSLSAYMHKIKMAEITTASARLQEQVPIFQLTAVS